MAPAKLFQRAHREAAIVVAKQRALALQRALEHAFAAPEPIDERYGLFGIFELKIAAVMVMLQIKRAIMSEVGVLDLDYRDRAGADILDQRFLDFLPA